MPRKGENIYKRKDGRWEGRYIKSKSSPGTTSYGYCYGKSYKEVKELLALKKGHCIVEPRKPADVFAFSKYCNEWLYLRKSKVEESSYVKYLSMMEKHILPGLGERIITDITSVVVEDFSQTLLSEKELSPKTVKDILVVLRSVIAYTEKSTKVGLKDIEITYPKENKKEMRVLSSEEQRRFAAFLTEEPDVFKLGMLISLVTGLRIGEICALRWREVSFTEKTIHIVSTMQRIKNTEQNAETKTKVIIKDPKSDASERVIPITDFGISLFRMLYRSGCPANAFVLTGREDKYIEPRVLQYHMSVYRDKCGLSGVHFHTLRHSFATRFAEIGCDIKSLSEILGHSNTKITLDRYVHSSLELKRANMMKLAEIGY